jgi:hypothetical protein
MAKRPAFIRVGHETHESAASNGANSCTLSITDLQGRRRQGGIGRRIAGFVEDKSELVFILTGWRREIRG